jgi:hypothetical protein
MALQNVPRVHNLAEGEAVQTGSPRVLYLDGLRNIIREGLIDPEIDDVFNIVSDWIKTNDLLQGSTGARSMSQWRVGSGFIPVD